MALVAIPIMFADPCDEYLEDLLSNIRSQYRAGWRDAIEGNSDIQPGIYYKYGYDDATQWQYNNLRDDDIH